MARRMQMKKSCRGPSGIRFLLFLTRDTVAFMNRNRVTHEMVRGRFVMLAPPRYPSRRAYMICSEMGYVGGLNTMDECMLQEGEFREEVRKNPTRRYWIEERDLSG